MSPWRHRIRLLAALAGVAWINPATPALRGSETVVLVEIQDAIGPATKEHFLSALRHADESGAQLLVLVLDTPGGLDVAMRDMIQGILASRIPVTTFVAPSGARAASAGTFILYASHIAAMAPGTNVGAATPVPLGGAPPADAEDGGARDGERQEREDPRTGSASDRKSVNDAIAYIRSLADLRGRDPEFAEAAVRDAASLPAQEALKRGVIELISNDVPDLLEALDGREVRIGHEARRLKTKGAAVEFMEMDWRTSLLAVLTNPLVAYGLLIIGLYGLMFEGYNPGAILPGVTGAICLLLGLYALQVLSRRTRPRRTGRVRDWLRHTDGHRHTGIRSESRAGRRHRGFRRHRHARHDPDGDARTAPSGRDRYGAAGRRLSRGRERFQRGGSGSDLRRAVERDQQRTRDSRPAPAY
jgi:membrane-bound serine protease (ClpP class)